MVCPEMDEGERTKMTDEQLLNFCQDHNVEISFSFEPTSNSYLLRMRRWDKDSKSVIQSNHTIHYEECSHSAFWPFIIRTTLTDMLYEIEHQERRISSDQD